jgi:predicted heme/steroid binding protein
VKIVNKVKRWCNRVLHLEVQVKAGKCYMAKNGMVFGPLVQVSQEGYMFRDEASGYTWLEDGKHVRNCTSQYDLVKELTPAVGRATTLLAA